MQSKCSQDLGEKIDFQEEFRFLLIFLEIQVYLKNEQ
jgi:hypothetical protein